MTKYIESYDVKIWAKYIHIHIDIHVIYQTLEPKHTGTEEEAREHRTRPKFEYHSLTDCPQDTTTKRLEMSTV